MVAPVLGRRRRPPRPIRPRDPISVPAADASTLPFLPPVMSLIGPALYLLASILILLTPTRNSMSLLAAPPLPPDPDSDDNANNQHSVNAVMDSSPEDDRLQVNQSVRSSSPPPRAGGGGGAEHQRPGAAPGDRTAARSDGMVPPDRRVCGWVVVWGRESCVTF